MAIVVSLGASYINFFFHDLMEHVQLIFSVFGAPFWAIFLLGMSTRRTDAKGAIYGFLSGTFVSHSPPHRLRARMAALRQQYECGLSCGHLRICSGSVCRLVSSKGDTTHRANTLAFQWRATLTSAGGRVLLAVSEFLAAICLRLNFYWR